jgi:hypothetical protein
LRNEAEGSFSADVGGAWSFEKYGHRSKREQLLEEMNEVVPWRRLLSLVEPHYPKAGNGRYPVGLEIMLRAYFVQQWFNLLDPGLDSNEGVVHSVSTSAASVADVHMLPDLLHGEERKVGVTLAIRGKQIRSAKLRHTRRT